MKDRLLIGWASRSITPERPVLLAGQFHARVSEGVMDPITVTALALESVRDGRPAGQSVMVSCDYVGISESLLTAVRERLPHEIKPQNVCISATHTHTAPSTRGDDPQSIGSLPPCKELSEKELGVMSRAEYLAFASTQISNTIMEAWGFRAPGGICFGVGHATIGYNRRIVYSDGQTCTQGNTNSPEFSHLEGGSNPDVDLLFTLNSGEGLTGIVVNVACPSQVSELSFQVSADYWHETRLELRERFGDGLFILPQCSAAGDQIPHIPVNRPAEERMLRLSGRTQRQDIAVRIADAVASVLPFVDIGWNPILTHWSETIQLPTRKLTSKDVKDSLVEFKAFQQRYETLREELEVHPEITKGSRWYRDITAAYCGMVWNRGVTKRFDEQKRHPTIGAEVHVIRLGDVVFATNPFECYLDYGMQIKARSKAVQTFVVELTGPSLSYLPTARAILGNSYSATPASTPVGPEGGCILVNQSVRTINLIMEEQPCAY